MEVPFKTLSIGPALGIEPATSRSAVKRSTDWANPAAVSEEVKLCKIMEKKEERLGWREEKGWPWRSYCVLNYCFSETEIPDWWAACQYVNDKNISVRKGSNFHSRSNFHSSYLTMKGQFQLVCRSITLALWGSFAYSLFSSLSLRNPTIIAILHR